MKLDVVLKNVGCTVTKMLDQNINYFKNNTLRYVASQKVGNDVGVYKYSDSTQKPVLYASAYACMIRSLYGDLENCDKRFKLQWADYFDSFQDSKDGLFRDNTIQNSMFESEDWWGIRHLATHLIIAYNALGLKPKHDFYFLEPFYNSEYVRQWLESRDWDTRFDFVGNEVMNYGVLLQYSRDFFGNTYAGVGVSTMLDWLSEYVDPNSGLWGTPPFDSPEKISRGVQGSYHVYPLFFYDKRKILYGKNLVDYTLSTQNSLGGFGVGLNSSACEDIDSIDILIRMYRIQDYRRQEIMNALWKALPWVISNWNMDGGWVFRRNESFEYGHPNMYSGENESSMFATWFRTLCLAYLVNFLIKKNYLIKEVPGYEFS